MIASNTCDILNYTQFELDQISSRPYLAMSTELIFSIDFQRFNYQMKVYGLKFNK
jgi:hypothetical protein